MSNLLTVREINCTDPSRVSQASWLLVPPLHAYETVSDVRAGLARYFTFFNKCRPHSATVLPRELPLIDTA